MRSGTNVIKIYAVKVFPFFQKKAAGLKMRSAAFFHIAFPGSGHFMRKHLPRGQIFKYSIILL